ncbi:hypothetical protein [Armatimonas rosea]|uniref:WD40 repeat protein n=1 Tax=Armatimonas rosea TaxID=685828 RepID=A0A7W9SV49_ARMRO|nr:hypothetical protein [Armatimonas rosea]MBB6053241.1 hypothetical protein [Armatimonas rosea]
MQPSLSRRHSRVVGLSIGFLVPLVAIGLYQGNRPPVGSRATQKLFPRDPIPQAYFELPDGADGTFVFTRMDTIVAGLTKRHPDGVEHVYPEFLLLNGKLQRYNSEVAPLYPAVIEKNKELMTKIPVPENIASLLPAGATRECLALSWDKVYVAMGYTDGIVIWESATGKLRRQIKRHNGFPQYSYLQFSSDGQLLGDAYVDGIALWDWQKGT